MRAFAVLLVTFALMAPSAHAAPLHGGTKFDLGGSESAGYKAAVSRQSLAVGAAWGTGQVTFGRGGVPVFFAPLSVIQQDCGGPPAIACHGNNGTQLYILVATHLGTAVQQYAIDHEIVETMVDPYPYTDPTMVNGQRAEVCDPDDAIVWSGIYALAGWVAPNYYINGGLRLG
jgi:hypothetical protein